MDKYAVFGNPIKHSKSPAIHTQFAASLGEQVDYRAILASTDGFKNAVKDFFNSGGLGVNVTSPFKEQAFELVDQKTEQATVAGAVNTIKRLESGELLGDNTDGIGFVNDLLANNVLLKDQTILLIGAGGAARGVILPLLQQQPKELIVVNRTAEKAQNLAALFKQHGEISGYGFESLPNKPYSIVINSTSSSVKGELPNLDSIHLAFCHVLYDMFYSQGNTVFMEWGLKHNKQLKVLDGSGMLVGQAAQAYYVWRNKMPAIIPVVAMLKNGELK